MKLKAQLFIAGLLFSSFAVVFTAPAMAEEILLLPLPGIGTFSVADVTIEPFDLPDSWETYTNPFGVDLSIENGIYRAYTATPGYVWGLNEQMHSDLVAEVEVTPLTPFQDIGAGVMCRADVSNNGDGYYFMINASGYVSISVGHGDGIDPLVDWTPSNAVHTGIDRNKIRAVCLGDALAMYVNDELVAEVIDTTYSSGYAGMAVAAGNNGVDFAFDNLTLYNIQLH